jgi:hypothetical protein
LTESPGHSTSARSVAEVHGIIVDLKVDPDTVLLFIMLGADGSITRRGTGALGNTHKSIFIGITDPTVFKMVRSHLTERMLRCLGRSFRHKNVRGAPCKLALAFLFNDKKSDGCEYFYGSESEGPPSDVAAFVTAAVRETEKWYQEQLRLTSG